VLLVGLFALISGESEPKTTTLSVTLLLIDEDGCDVGLGYFDVPGSAITVEGDGELVAFGQLDSGSDDVFSCEFRGTVLNVPTDAISYTISVGRRGTKTYTRSELEANNWELEYSLGI
jgi:hypothetical protein